MDLVLVCPTEEKKLDIWAYREEFLLNGDSMDGTAGLKNVETFEKWFSDLKENSCDMTIHKGFVPSTTYLGVQNSDGKIIGMIDIRHRLNESLLEHGGHIGYSVRKSERCKGYATELLRLALIKCRELQIEKVLITCDKNNIASIKTILSNEGVLENEIFDGDRITQRYWINFI